MRKNPYLTYNFLVEIEGIFVGGFMEASGLSISTEVDRKRFGGENDRQYIFAKGTKYTDLTLKRGLTDLDLLWRWYEEVIKGRIKRKDVSICLRNHSGNPAVRWNFCEAYPIKWDGPTFNAASSKVATEQLVLAHHGLTK